MIKAVNLLKKYKRFQLSIENLEIEKGESFGLVGNNGAGKSTLFNLIMDLIKPDKGNVAIKEYEVSKSKEWKFFTSAFLNNGFLIDFLTTKEYFHFIGKLYNKTAQELDLLANEYKDFLPEDIFSQKKYIRDLSEGNKVKIGIIASLIGNPEILILDEPFAHLDPRSQIQLKNILKKLNLDKQTTLLISSHDLNHLTDVSKRICLLENGKIIKDFQRNENTLKELENYFSV